MLGKPCWSQYEMYPISGYFSKLGAHLTMLSDENRMNAFESALAYAIVPGKSVVLDVGAGTGVLAMMASKMGAKKVYAVEMGDIANVASKLILRNGLAEKIELMRGHLSEIELPEKVDVIVSETLGFTGLEENIVGVFDDAMRFAKSNTIIIPSCVRVFAAPSMDTDVCENLINVWRKPAHGLDFSYLSELAGSNVFVRQLFKPDSFLADPAIVARVPLLIAADKEYGLKQVFIAGRSGKASGLAGWFDANMLPGSRLSSAPETNKLNNHWQQFFISLPEKIDLQLDDELVVLLRISSDWEFKWRVQHMRTGKVYNIDNGLLGKVLKGKQ